jgi:hypothetical protein
LREYARMRGAREIWWRDGRAESVIARHPERKGLE